MLIRVVQFKPLVSTEFQEPGSEQTPKLSGGYDKHFCMVRSFSKIFDVRTTAEKDEILSNGIPVLNHISNYGNGKRAYYMYKNMKYKSPYSLFKDQKD